jgi:hypothetical protein
MFECILRKSEWRSGHGTKRWEGWEQALDRVLDIDCVSSLLWSTALVSFYTA